MMAHGGHPGGVLCEDPGDTFEPFILTFLTGAVKANRSVDALRQLRIVRLCSMASVYSNHLSSPSLFPSPLSPLKLPGNETKRVLNRYPRKQDFLRSTLWMWLFSGVSDSTQSTEHGLKRQLQLRLLDVAPPAMRVPCSSNMTPPSLECNCDCSSLRKCMPRNSNGKQGTVPDLNHYRKAIRIPIIPPDRKFPEYL